jgi:uncharacterized membrane protein YfcA
LIGSAEHCQRRLPLFLLGEASQAPQVSIVDHKETPVTNSIFASSAGPAQTSAADARRPSAQATTQPSAGSWGTLALIGAVGGALSGLFAIGGGILMVPLLVWRAGMDQRRAAATSLLAIIPAAVVSSATYLVHGDVDVIAGVFVAAGAVIGALVGSRLLRRLPLAWLRWMFIVFILGIAVRLLLVEPGRGERIPLTPWVVFGYVALGLVMGVASGLFGIGGGIIAVPLLVSAFGIGQLVAKGTALLVSIPTSVVATVSNRRAGMVDIRAGLIIGAAAAAASVPAVYVAVSIPAATSSDLFAVLLLAVAAQLTVKAARHPQSA